MGPRVIGAPSPATGVLLREEPLEVLPHLSSGTYSLARFFSDAHPQWCLGHGHASIVLNALFLNALPLLASVLKPLRRNTPSEPIRGRFPPLAGLGSSRIPSHTSPLAPGFVCCLELSLHSYPF